MSRRILIGVLCAISLSMGCDRPGEQLPLPVSNAPISVPELLLDELRRVPFAEEPLAADTCLAVTRQEVVPVVKDQKLGFSDYGWNMSVKCPYVPGQVCFAPDDGRCICVPEPDPDDPAIPKPIPPLNPCRLVRETVRAQSPFGGLVLRSLSCDGSCVERGTECRLRQLAYRGGRGFAFGCTCVSEMPPVQLP